MHRYSTPHQCVSISDVERFHRTTHAINVYDNTMLASFPIDEAADRPRRSRGVLYAGFFYSTLPVSYLTVYWFERLHLLVYLSIICRQLLGNIHSQMLRDFFALGGFKQLQLLQFLRYPPHAPCTSRSGCSLLRYLSPVLEYMCIVRRLHQRCSFTRDRSILVK